jgi:hypothetical protein
MAVLDPLAMRYTFQNYGEAYVHPMFQLSDLSAAGFCSVSWGLSPRHQVETVVSPRGESLDN